MRNHIHKGLTASFLLLAAFATMGSECQPADSGTKSQREEQAQQGASYRNILRNQPPPAFDFSMERHIMIEIYKARQRAVATYSVVQSEFTGKVLWSCPSVGYPVPYSTQITNPSQIVDSPRYQHDYVMPQPEPNALFPPAQAEATWVPCVDSKGSVTPVYEEKKVTVFLQPMVEKDGQLQPREGSKPSLEIKGPQQ